MSSGHGSDFAFGLAISMLFEATTTSIQSSGENAAVRAQGQVVYGQHLIFDIIASGLATIWILVFGFFIVSCPVMNMHGCLTDSKLM